MTTVLTNAAAAFQIHSETLLEELELPPPPPPEAAMNLAPAMVQRLTGGQIEIYE